MRSLIASVIALCVIGCTPLAQVTWSPDGKLAYYHQNVVDNTGKVLDTLGPFDGPAVWSADSATLYFIGSNITDTGPATTPMRQWADGVDADKDLAPPKSLPPGFPRSTIYRRRDGKNEPLVTLWQMWTDSLAVSADQNWLLIQGKNIHGFMDFQTGLMAYNLNSKKLHVVSNHADAYCFMSNDTIAFVDNSCVYQTALDDSLPKLVLTPVLSLMPNATSAIAASGNGLLVQTAQATFPAPATQPVATNIYAVSADGKQFRNLATVALGDMSLSPDGKRILFIRTNVKNSSELAMINVDGTQQRLLIDLSVFDHGLPMMPTWHGNDRITFASTTSTVIRPQKDGDESKTVYDVVDYSIPPNGTMQPVQTLSQDWKPEMKPSPARGLGNLQSR